MPKDRNIMVLNEADCQPGIVARHPETDYRGVMLYEAGRYIPARITPQEWARITARAAGPAKPCEHVCHHD